MPYPPVHDSSRIGPFLAHMAPYYANDYRHLSAEGHVFVADGIRGMLNGVLSSQPPLGVGSTAATTKATTTTTTTTSTKALDAMDAMSVVRPWTVQDSCENWILTGQCPHQTIGNNMVLTLFDQAARKYALEVRPTEVAVNYSEAVGEILVNNNFPSEAGLYLSYMSTAAPSKYPPVRITVYQQDATDMETNDVTSHVVSSMDLYPEVQRQAVHVAVTAPPLTLSPGTNRIIFEPLGKTDWPFRIVATSIAQSVGAETLMGRFDVGAAAEARE